jgi:hypothetical protein
LHSVKGHAKVPHRQPARGGLEAVTCGYALTA